MKRIFYDTSILTVGPVATLLLILFEDEANLASV